MIKNNSFFILSSSCVFTKGNQRTLVQDFTRNIADFIPNGYYELLCLLNRHRVCEIAHLVSEDSHKEFSRFLQFMIEREYAFLTTNVELYPQKNYEFDNELRKIESAILEIDFDRSDIRNMHVFLAELQSLDCRDLQIRMYNIKQNTPIRDLLIAIQNYNFDYIELHIENGTEISVDYCKSIILEIPSLSNVFLYGRKENKKLPIVLKKDGYYDLNVGSIFILTNLFNEHSCGHITKHSLVWGDEAFYHLSKQYNSCLYKRVTLDRQGKIKNCPALPESYELKTGLANIVSSDNFRKYWKIIKDDIHVCKDCEYRYNCLDCRAGVALLEKPTKCGYNPLTNKWEN